MTEAIAPASRSISGRTTVVAIIGHPTAQVRSPTSVIAEYARRGIEYFTKNKVFPVDGSVTLSGLRVNIAVQFRDGVLKQPLPEPEKYVDQKVARDDLR